MSSNPFDSISNSYSQPVKKKKKNLFDTEDNPFDSINVSQSQLQSTNPFDTGIVAQSQPILQQPQKEEPSFFNRILKAANIIDNPVSDFIGGVIKDTGQVLSAPLYGVTKFFDSIMDDTKQSVVSILSNINNPIDGPISFVKTIPAIPKAIEAGVLETGRNLGQVLNTDKDLGTLPPEQLSFKDLIKEHDPEFAKQYPITASALGFVGDVALDPLTYISFGADTGIKLAGEKLSNEGIDLLKNLNQVVDNGFRYTIRNKQGVERIGTIGIDEINKLQNVQNLVELGYGAKEGEQAALNQLSTILNANTKGFKGKLVSVEALTPAERTWSIESQFNELVKSNPNLIQKGGDLGLFVDIPFSPKRITLISPETVDKIIDKIPGINKIRTSITENLRDSPTFGLIARDFPLENQQAYLDLRHTLEGEKNIVDHSLMSSIADYTTLNSESRKNLADLMIKIDQRLTDKLEQSGKDYLPIKSVMQTRQYALNKALSDGIINNDEFEVATKFIDAHNKLAQSELNAKLFNQVKDNINFFSKDILNSPMVESGNLDLALLRALQIKSEGYKQAINNFDEGLKLLYGKINEKGDLVLEREAIPKNVQRDLNLIGDSGYSQKTTEYMKPFLNGIGRFNNIFKLTAYGLRPAAAVKQYVANTIQAYSKIGGTAFKNFDPRAIIDAALIISDNSAYRKYIPTLLMDGMQKFATPTGKMIYAIDRFQPELAKEFGFVNRMGERVSGDQLAKELMQQDIYQKGLDILSLEQTKDLKLKIAKLNGFSEFQKEKWHEGFGTFLKESIPWINLPNYVENMNKVATYINARKLGYLPEQARELTKKALFDYAHGTTKFENEFMKRIVPFYTFQRFAVPLVASLVKNPGKASNIVKMTKEFFEVYNLAASGQQLSDAQRQVLPGFLLEQPNAFNGYTKENGITKGVFNTFNSYLFTDWLSLVHTNTDGSIDFPKTVQKLTLAQITPLLKVPIEWLANKQFFTDMPFPSSDKKAQISSGKMVDWFEKNVPDLAKHLMSYELRTDPITGEKKGYINPYLTYAMSSFAPFLTDYVNISKNDMNAREFAMKYLAGIGTTKLDFQKEQHYRIKEWQDKIKELQKQMRTAMLANRPDIVSKSQEDLQQIIKRISQLSNLNVQ